ncbi:MAG: PQQ-dependent sugar dehydrogenase, partial [Pseudomonadota bacterium]
SANQPFSNHNGGQINFGADGYLYFGLGDGGSGNDPINAGQRLDTQLGAMLRIDVDSGTPYAIPPDNPFANAQCNTGGCPEIYAWGFRNPWRWSFDSLTGDLWMGDVGQRDWEEINRVERGENYGWRCYEGSSEFNTQGCGSAANYTPPIAEYGHINGHCSVTGGHVYRGSLLPHLNGHYIYGDFCSGQLWSLNTVGPPFFATPLINTSLNPSAFGQSHDGEVYVVNIGGNINQIVPDQVVGNEGGPATNLSETGCVDPTNPQQAASGMIPYDLNVPFWSDGATKMRWMGLPNGAQVTVDAQGDWHFPIGSVLMKHFSLGAELVETRLFMHHDNGEWAGYSYQWNDSQTDAVLLDNSLQVTVQNQTWHFPAREACTQCHTAAANRALGPEIQQLNREQVWPSTGRTANILTTAEAIGLLASPLTDEVGNLPALPEIDDGTQSIADRSKAWLHSNCASCHRPGGPTPVNLDLRFSTSLNAMGICDVAPNAGDLGLSDPRIVAVGDASRSVLIERINRRDAVAMPPLASELVDASAVQLLSDWVNALQSCD